MKNLFFAAKKSFLFYAIEKIEKGGKKEVEKIYKNRFCFAKYYKLKEREERKKDEKNIFLKLS
jgi:hypothetical protein